VVQRASGQSHDRRTAGPRERPTSTANPALPSDSFDRTPRQLDVAAASLRITQVLAPRPVHLRDDRRPQRLRRHREPALPSLPIANMDTAASEIHVLQPQSEALHQPEPGAVQKRYRQPMGFCDSREQPRRFPRRQQHPADRRAGEREAWPPDTASVPVARRDTEQQCRVRLSHRRHKTAGRLRGSLAADTLRAPIQG